MLSVEVDFCSWVKFVALNSSSWAENIQGDIDLWPNSILISFDKRLFSL